MKNVLNDSELKLFKKLNTPQKIQNYLDTIPINFELTGQTLYSPRKVLIKRKAHCMEGALLAAAVLYFHGRKPLLLDLRTTKDDWDHVVTLFQDKSGWGAISKTNHGVLGFRDPIYKNVRELTMSYFHEYYLMNREKTLREYSSPFNLARYKPEQWITSMNNLWFIDDDLEKTKHFKIVSGLTIKKLRLADKIQTQLAFTPIWKKPNKKNASPITKVIKGPRTRVSS